MKVQIILEGFKNPMHKMRFGNAIGNGDSSVLWTLHFLEETKFLLTFIKSVKTTTIADKNQTTKITNFC